MGGGGGKAAAPTADPPPGYVVLGAAVNLTSRTPNAAIYSTTSTGNPPERNAAGNPVINEDTTLISFARAAGYEDSDEVTLEYQVGATPETLEDYLKDYLKEKEENTPDNPYTIVFLDETIDLLSDWPKVGSALLSAERYVILDLSRLTLNDRDTVTGANFVAADEESDPSELPSDGDFNIIWDNQMVMGLVLPASLQTVGPYALNWCYMLESVTIPNGVTGIGIGAFAYCHALKSVVIPDSVESIGHSAFFSSRSLESVTIGSGVKDIHNWAFGLCGVLKSVTFRGSGAVIETDASFPEGAGLRAAYEAGGAGTYTLSEGVWTKR
ncbi:MAG: leucine-rich repeat domain-containing protein [Treponematales bacterium]